MTIPASIVARPALLFRLHAYNYTQYSTNFHKNQNPGLFAGQNLVLTKVKDKTQNKT